MDPALKNKAHHHGPGLDYEEEKARRDLARMIAVHGHHPSVVEGRHFRSFVACAASTLD